MRRIASLVISGLALGLTAACVRAEPPRAATTTTITTRVPSLGLADSVAGPSPAGMASRMVPEVVAGVTGASGASPIQAPDLDAASDADAARGLCASQLRDPATGERFVAHHTQVNIQPARPRYDGVPTERLGRRSAADNGE